MSFEQLTPWGMDVCVNSTEGKREQRFLNLFQVPLFYLGLLALERWALNSWLGE